MVTIAAIVAAILLALMAGVQVGLALGAPWGSVVWGGRHEGRLPRPLRLASALAVPILGLAASVVLARAGVVGWTPIPSDALGVVTWVLAGFMVLNTVGNLASKSRFERVVFGPATALVAVLCAVVAMSGPGPA